MIPQNTFSKLSFKEKGKLVFESGRFIAYRMYYNQKLVLYDLGEFFAEVRYEPGENRIHRIDALEPGDKRIDRYIDSETKPAR